MNAQAPHVLKVGGSLLAMPGLLHRLSRLIEVVDDHAVAVVVGGGAAADWVRRCDDGFSLGQEQGHWCAVRAMQLNAHMLAACLPRSSHVKSPEAARQATAAGTIAIVEPLAWLQADEQAGLGVPHRWSFTSDSIAAHVAVRLGSHNLTLLKSTLPDPEDDLDAAAHRGVVDADFPRTARPIRSIRIVNLRHDGPEPASWQPRRR